MFRPLNLVDNGDTADLYIYGDVVSSGWEWSDADSSANSVMNELKGLKASKLNVYINSFGGDVADGLAIYHALRDTGAEITTVCSGFACSIASVIFMAGDIRKMYSSSLLMIHNVWSYAQGNADDFRKAADDLDVINQTIENAYLDEVNIDAEKLKELLDAETWLTPDSALEMGFCSEIIENKATSKACASAFDAIFNKLTKPKNEDEKIDLIISMLSEIKEKIDSEMPEEDEESEETPEEEEETKKAENDFLSKFKAAFNKKTD